MNDERHPIHLISSVSVGEQAAGGRGGGAGTGKLKEEKAEDYSDEYQQKVGDSIDGELSATSEEREKWRAELPSEEEQAAVARALRKDVELLLGDNVEEKLYALPEIRARLTKKGRTAGSGRARRHGNPFEEEEDSKDYTPVDFLSEY